MDTQIKQSWLRISHSKVFSSGKITKVISFLDKQVNCTVYSVHSSSFHVPGRISISQGKQYSTNITKSTYYIPFMFVCTFFQWLTPCTVYCSLYTVVHQYCFRWRRIVYTELCVYFAHPGFYFLMFIFTNSGSSGQTYLWNLLIQSYKNHKMV